MADDKIHDTVCNEDVSSLWTACIRAGRHSVTSTLQLPPVVIICYINALRTHMTMQRAEIMCALCSCVLVFPRIFVAINLRRELDVTDTEKPSAQGHEQVSTYFHTTIIISLLPLLLL